MSAEPAARQSEIISGSLDYGQRRRQAGLSSITPPSKAVRRNGVLVFEHQESQLLGLWEKDVRALMIQCCAEYPLISTDPEVVGGIPHLNGTRISVGQVLGRIYMLESIQGVVDYYQGRISSDQVKEALAYAQDFIETACEPLEDHG
jgi:uncharacterized protein (DUF433 family)